ncbi:MAG: hypothetical protein ACR2LC_14090 [Pyrinomonadaceae bacterium]
MLILAFAENSVQLVPDGTLFLHIAIILLMVFVLNATLFKPINRILEERENRIKGGAGSTQDILRRIDDALNRYEQTLREARADGYHSMEEARAAAMQERQNKLSTMRDEVSRALEAEKASISAQTETARGTLASDAQRIATEIGAHLLHRPISSASANYDSSLNA